MQFCFPIHVYSPTRASIVSIQFNIALLEVWISFRTTQCIQSFVLILEEDEKRNLSMVQSVGTSIVLLTFKTNHYFVTPLSEIFSLLYTGFELKEPHFNSNLKGFTPLKM